MGMDEIAVVVHEIKGRHRGTGRAGTGAQGGQAQGPAPTGGMASEWEMTKELSNLDQILI